MDQKLIYWARHVSPAEEQLQSLRNVLREIAQNPQSNDKIPFGQLGALHFASLTLFDEEDHKADPLLVFECNVDAPCLTFVQALVQVGRRGLDELFAGVKEYPHGGTDEAVADYLMGQKRRGQLHHEGHPHLSVSAITGDFELRRSIARELEADLELRNRSPAGIIDEIRMRANVPKGRRRLRPWHDSWSGTAQGDPTPLEEIRWLPEQKSWQRARFIAAFSALGWIVGAAIDVATHATFGISHSVAIGTVFLLTLLLFHKASVHVKLLKGATIAGLLAGAIAAAVRFVPFLAAPPGYVVAAAWVVVAPVVFLLVSNASILTTLPLTRTFPILDGPARERLRRLAEAEERPENGGYNHVAGLSVLAESFPYRPVRWLRTFLVLGVLNFFYRTLFVRGRLLSIPTIHFAQWSLVDRSRLLFLTNYDGGADSYLDDFFNTLAYGVAFIWIDTTIFPGTIDPRHLKAWVRRGQTLASVRYRAPVYEHLTVGAINSNVEIRKRLLRGHDESSARTWLSRFAISVEKQGVFARFVVWLRHRISLPV